MVKRLAEMPKRENSGQRNAGKRNGGNKIAKLSKRILKLENERLACHERLRQLEQRVELLSGTASTALAKTLMAQLFGMFSEAQRQRALTQTAKKEQDEQNQEDQDQDQEDEDQDDEDDNSRTVERGGGGRR